MDLWHQIRKWWPLFSAINEMTWNSDVVIVSYLQTGLSWFRLHRHFLPYLRTVISSAVHSTYLFCQFTYLYLYLVSSSSFVFTSIFAPTPSLGISCQNVSVSPEGGSNSHNTSVQVREDSSTMQIFVCQTIDFKFFLDQNNSVHWFTFIPIGHHNDWW